ncbi:cytochrome P450 [Prauserella flavalba]|uniref:Cytochrome n=1 Tax=Prauserella flavalba TaxID=1477506 RepID=A0A318LH42_9PSEU|nr:cytochrome P450 [Prauserella flavalba]PXY24062.1 cytochrome [Prauserella flavalba]
MNRTELRMALRTLSFLDSQAHREEGFLELAGEPRPKLLVWHPEAIDWIFHSDPGLEHPGSRSLMPLFGKDSLLWVDGPRHSSYRRLLGPPLRGRRLHSYRDLIAHTVHEAVDALRPGQVVSIPEWTRQVALRVMGRLVLGDGAEGLLKQFADWIERALGARGRTLAYRFLLGGLPRSSAELDRQLVDKAKANAETEPRTLAALLLSQEGLLGQVDDHELRDQIVSLLFAGHETTAAATAWTLYWIDRDENLRHDLRTELAAVSDDAPEPAQVPLLQAVIQEALRLAPPVTVAENRKLPEGGEILGRSLPPGSVVTTSIYLAHRRPDYFPDPLRFDPGRFLSRRVPPQHYLPFGGGSRHCLGNQLGQLETRMITAALLRRREWHCVNPEAAVLQLRGHAMAPATKLRMKVTACRN